MEQKPQPPDQLPPGKRLPQYLIDSKTLQPISQPKQDPIQPSAHTSTPELPKNLMDPVKCQLFSKDCSVTVATATTNQNKPLFSQMNFSLFTNNKPSTKDQQVKSLFANYSTALSTEGLFGKKSEENKPQSSLFGKPPPFGTGSFLNLFNNNKDSLFKFNEKTPPVTFQANHQNEEESSSEADQLLQKEQQMIVDKEKTKKDYKYEEECEIIKKTIVKKLRKDAGDIILNSQVSLEKDKSTNLHSIVVRLPQTKNCVFAGVIIKGKSEVHQINNKAENLEVTVARMEKDKAQKHTLKIQFETPQIGGQFETLIRKISQDK